MTIQQRIEFSNVRRAPRYFRVFLHVTIFAIAHLACGSDAPSTPPFTRHDSAGIAVIENHTPAWSDVNSWRISAEPTISIGYDQEDSAQALFNVRGAIRLKTGEILIANGGGHQLRLYDVTGQHIRDIGASGSGPGEFTGLWRMWRYRGDSVLTFDIQQLRLSVFSSNGAFVRSFRLRPTRDVRIPIPIDVFADGSVLVQAGSSVQMQEQLEFVRSEMILGEWSPSGRFIRMLGKFPGRELFFFPSERGPFPNTPLLQRKSEALIRDDRLVIGSNDRYELDIYSRNLGLERIIRKDHLNPPASDKDVSTLTELVLETASDQNTRRELENELRAMPVHKTLPAFGWPALPENFSKRAIFADRGNNLWVLEYQLPNQTPLTWTIFAPDGILLGTLKLPHNFEVFELGIDYVLGVTRDELGVETVRVYSLAKPKRGVRPVDVS